MLLHAFTRLSQCAYITLPFSHYNYVRSGNTNSNTGTVRWGGVYSNYWSGASRSEVAGAYNLYFGVSEVNPSVSNGRFCGFSARCHISVMRNSVLTSNRMCRYASSRLRKCLWNDRNVADCVGEILLLSCPFRRYPCSKQKPTDIPAGFIPVKCAQLICGIIRCWYFVFMVLLRQPLFHPGRGK